LPGVPDLHPCDEALNPGRLAYRVLFADTAPQDEGKRAVKDFILSVPPTK
jgi:hypothetical protein